MGMYYEDFEDAGEFVTASRPVTEADVRAFAEVSGDRNPIHLDREAAVRAGFEGPIAHGALGLSVATGLANQLELTRGTLVALVGVTWRFRGAIYYGDQVTLHLRVASRRATGSPTRGLVTLAAELKNQRGEVVQDGEFIELIARRPHEEGSS
ncbi:MAG: dehydratase [Gemmatimonadales bacterium]|nr:MAG: dehydratase [Gemmatimonadales bacterium]